MPSVADVVKSVLLLNHGSLHVSIEELVLERMIVIVSWLNIQVVIMILISVVGRAAVVEIGVVVAAIIITEVLVEVQVGVSGIMDDLSVSCLHANTWVVLVVGLIVDGANIVGFIIHGVMVVHVAELVVVVEPVGEEAVAAGIVNFVRLVVRLFFVVRGLVHDREHLHAHSLLACLGVRDEELLEGDGVGRDSAGHERWLCGHLILLISQSWSRRLLLRRRSISRWRLLCRGLRRFRWCGHKRLRLGSSNGRRRGGWLRRRFGRIAWVLRLAAVRLGVWLGLRLGWLLRRLRLRFRRLARFLLLLFRFLVVLLLLLFGIALLLLPLGLLLVALLQHHAHHVHRHVGLVGLALGHFGQRWWLGFVRWWLWFVA